MLEFLCQVIAAYKTLPTAQGPTPRFILVGTCYCSSHGNNVELGVALLMTSHPFGAKFLSSLDYTEPDLS